MASLCKIFGRRVITFNLTFREDFDTGGVLLTTGSLASGSRNITIGGGGGALKTNQVLNFNPGATGTDRPAGDIYLALCKAMGVPATSFGNATNPLLEILA